MFPTSTRTLLLGTDESKTKRWSVLVGVLLGGSLLYFGALNAVAGYGWPLHVALWWEGYAVLLGALVAGQAYATAALAVSWGSAFAAVFGLLVNRGGVGVVGPPPGPVATLAVGLAGGTLAALTLGTLGFVVGTTLRGLGA
ncbi:hypothetical protein [Haloplanus halophilus]|uniref:hypothetical protein n=1 Tax=Haloplanus halophilus TaxID=2949993 RepID=UPI002042501A|nr:hypothetical protein [Haloplanus sp. GDY1]